MKDKSKNKSKENLLQRSRAILQDPFAKKVLQTGAILLAIFFIGLGYIQIADYLEERYPANTVVPKVEVEEVKPEPQPIDQQPKGDQTSEVPPNEKQPILDEESGTQKGLNQETVVEEDFLPEYPTNHSGEASQEEQVGGNKVEEMLPPVAGEIAMKYGMVYWEIFEDFRFHDGVDIKTKDTKAKAALPGVVVEIITEAYEGTMVVVEHQGGWKTYYGNLETIEVSLEEKIDQGENLGSLKKDKDLHFGLYLEEQSVDPMKYLKL